MSGEWKDSQRERAERLQEAFNEAAAELDLRLDPAAGSDPRCIGVAFIILPFVAYDLDDSESPAGHADDESISNVVHRLETMTVAQFHAGEWRNYAYDPHVSVTATGLGKIDQAAVEEWLASPEFQEYLQEYPPKTPRDVKIQQLKVVYLGQHQAAATYRVVETFANGKVTAGNSAMMLGEMKNVGWRAVVTSKGGREELPGHPHHHPHQHS